MKQACQLQVHNGSLYLAAMCSFFPLVYHHADDYAQMKRLEKLEKPAHPPEQMGLEQYMAIVSVLLGKVRPRMLFYGCGRDTRAWHRLVRVLDGELVVLEGTEDWLTLCQTDGVDVRLVHYNQTNANTQLQLLRHDLWANQIGMLTLDDDLTSGRGFDLIVVDGPQGYLMGRAQSLSTSLHLARQQSPPGHLTHIFLHDSSRPGERELIRIFLGDGPPTRSGFVTDHMRRKGLVQYVIPSLRDEQPQYEGAAGRAQTAPQQ
jgi:IRX15/IRX15L/GXM